MRGNLVTSGEVFDPRRLADLVYEHLRRVAESYLRRERPDHTLQATALVHEAYLKVSDYDKEYWTSREEFVAFASHLMRQVLVDHAIRHKAIKRGGKLAKKRISQVCLAAGKDPLDVVALDEALTKLGELNPRGAKIVELRFFGGLTVLEVAKAISVSESLVAREWREARAWLLCEISQG